MSEKKQWMEFLQEKLEQHMDEKQVKFTGCKQGEYQEKFAEAMLETIADVLSVIKPIGRGLRGDQR